MHNVVIKTKFSAFLSQENAQLNLPFIYFEVQKNHFEFINRIMIPVYVSQCLCQDCHINYEVYIFCQS